MRIIFAKILTPDVTGGRSLRRMYEACSDRPACLRNGSACVALARGRERLRRPRKRAAARGHLHQGHRADSAALLSELPSAGPDGADVAADVPGRAPVGPVDQAARRRRARCRRGASIRTSASRASRTIRRCARTRSRRSSKWVDAGAPMGNAADMPKPREFDDSDRWHIGKPDLIVTSPPHKVPAEAVRLVGQLLRRHRPHRGSLHQGDREQAREDRRRASPAHLCRRCGRERRQQRRRQQRRSRRVPQRVRGRQERRPVPRGHGPPAEGRIEDQVRLPLSLGRPGNHRPVAARHRALSEGLRAEARRLLEAAGPADRAARHPGRIDVRPQRRLHALQQGREASRRSSRTCTRAASGSASS